MYEEFDVQPTTDAEFGVGVWTSREMPLQGVRLRVSLCIRGSPNLENHFVLLISQNVAWRSNNFPLISHIIILTRVYIYFHLLLFVCGLTQFRKLSMTFYSIYLIFLTFHSCSMVDWMNRQSLNKLIVKNFLIEFSILAESVQPSNRSKQLHQFIT